MCRGKPCFTLVNLCLSSLLLCSLCSKSNEHTSLFLPLLRHILFQFSENHTLYSGFEGVVYRSTGGNLLRKKYTFFKLNFGAKWVYSLLCFFVKTLPCHSAINVWIVQCAQVVIVNGGTWWPPITFQRASPCLVGHLMRDKECLKNRGDVKELSIPFHWHYLKWDLLQVDKNREPKTYQKKRRDNIDQGEK